ncbi:MAG: hypothetical protein ACRDTZ_17630 [Pseudonocardiaceae bacterium]
MWSAMSRHHPSSEAGGAASGLVLAILVLAAVGVAAFFWLGGEADVDIKTPDKTVTTTDSS